MAGPDLAPLQEALNLRLIGALVWQFAGIAAIHTVWSLLHRSPFTALGLLTFLAFYVVAHVLLLLAMHVMLSAAEPMPLSFPRLRVSQNSVASIALARLFVRNRSLKDAASAAVFHLSFVLSAAAYTYLYSDGSSWAMMLGRTTAAIFSCTYLLTCQEVLQFPSIQRKRYWRIRSSCSAVVKTAVRTAAAATLLTIIISFFVPSARPDTPRQAVAAPITCVLCTLCWAYTAQVGAVVMSERLPHFKDDLDAVMIALRQPDPVIQDTALLELAHAVEDRSGAGRQMRGLIFQDVSGGRYLLPLVQFGLDNLTGFVTAASKPLAAPAASGSAQDPRPGAASWNQLRAAPAGSVKGAPASDADAVPWLLRSSCQRVGLCLRCLAALAAASRTEDQYGVLLQSVPGLMDVVAALLSCLLTVQHCQKHLALQAPSARLHAMFPLQPKQPPAGQKGPWHPAAATLEDVASQAVTRCADAFRDTPKELLAGVAKTAPPYGTPAQLQDLLRPFL